MPIRDKGTEQRDNNICFSNKLVTMRIPGGAHVSTGAQMQSPQLQKQPALHHFWRLSPCRPLFVFALSSPGSYHCSPRIRPPLGLFFISVMGWASASGKTVSSQVLQSWCCLSQGWDQGQDAGSHHRAWWKGHWVRSQRTCLLNPSLATGSVTKDGSV